MVQQGDNQSVRRSTLHSLFERLFGGKDGAPKTDGDARLTAHLSARLDEQRAAWQEVSDGPEGSPALTAAYLDGGLGEAAQQDFHARFARSPADFHEIASADAFMDAIAAARETAPADLVASTIARSRTATVLVLPSRRTVLWKWSGIAVAMVAAAIAVLVIVNRQMPPTDSKTPSIAKTAPGSGTVPQSPVIAQPQDIQSPAVAGKEPSPSTPAMAPVASPEPAPSPSPRPKPAMAPEGFDTMPNPAPPR